MSRSLSALMVCGVAMAALAPWATGSAAAAVTTRMSCKGAILGFTSLGDHRLATYQDADGHRIELWCTRRVFDSQFDLRVAVDAPGHGRDGDAHPRQPEQLATIAGCYFDDGDNDGPIIVRSPNGDFAKVEWITADPDHRRQYRFSYDFSSGLLTVTGMVSGCAPATKILAPQPSYRSLHRLLPHPDAACVSAALGNQLATTPSP